MGKLWSDAKLHTRFACPDWVVSMRNEYEEERDALRAKLATCEARVAELEARVVERDAIIERFDAMIPIANGDGLKMSDLFRASKVL